MRLPTSHIDVHGKLPPSADSSDEQHRINSPLFLGVPNAIKDLVPTRGEPTRLGSRAYKYMIAPFDGAVAKHINAGGFISLGKLATSEFGVLPTTEPDIHPPTRNRWDQSRTSGGSSGGSSAAVAAGLVAMAHGSDGGGSCAFHRPFAISTDSSRLYHCSAIYTVNTINWVSA